MFSCLGLFSLETAALRLRNPFTVLPGCASMNTIASALSVGKKPDNWLLEHWLSLFAP